MTWGATIFFQLVSARYVRGSIIRWGGIFWDPISATAILDRLLHHSTTINIRGESYRLKDRRRVGLLPGREQEEGEAAALSVAPLQLAPPKADSEVLWGGEFSTGVDTESAC